MVGTGQNFSKFNGLISFGCFSVDVAERRLYRDADVVPLVRKVFDLLLLLLQDPGHLKTREELIDALWPDTIVEEQGLTSKMHALRRALGDEGREPQYIETVRGIGYRFIAPVITELPADAAGSAAVSRAVNARRLLPGLAAVLLLALMATAANYFFGARHKAPSDVTGVFPTIAVLPFENLDPDNANAFFASGIQDTILTRLASIRDIRVISRTSADSFSSHPENLRKIARDLRATDILEGSVQRVGKQVLINVQLINAATDTHLWAATYTRTLNNVFNVEGDVARQVASALLMHLRPEQLKELAQPPTRDPEAYVLYLKANYDARRVFDRTNAVDPGTLVKQAIDLYREAISRDPGFALAYARLSVLESRSAWFNIGTDKRRTSDAEHDAQRALAVNPRLPLAHVASAYVYFYGHRNFPKALDQFQRALALQPYNADILGAIAAVHTRAGQWQAALSDLQQACQLDPQNPHWLESGGVVLMALRQYDDAGQWLNRALALEPDSYLASIRKLGILLLTGRVAALRAQLARLPAGVNPPGIKAMFTYQAAMLQRQPAVALTAIHHAPDWLTGTNTVGVVPRLLLQADAWTLAGNAARARKIYLQARSEIISRMRSEQNNPDMWSDLGMVDASLGNIRQAVEAGRHAVALLPVSRDAYSGTFYLVALAQIYARTDDAVAATKVIDQLLSMPAGRALSVRLLKLDPGWDRIRNTPEFKAVLKKHAAARATKTVS